MNINNENTEDVYRRLRAFRTKYKLTQINMADAAQIRQASYSDIENGKTSTISKQTLKLFELILDMNIEWLLTGTGEMKKNRNVDNLLSEEIGRYVTPGITIPVKEYEKMKELVSTLQITIENLSKG